MRPKSSAESLPPARSSRSINPTAVEPFPLKPKSPTSSTPAVAAKALRASERAQSSKARRPRKKLEAGKVQGTTARPGCAKSCSYARNCRGVDPNQP
mmetsp:Transcript_17113/g.47967  ORF Transcript_17113/g.47967 Transcript_17113/m.47967 type:complete len:97 (+) Transcript_17113:513-803(+)